MPPPAKHGPNQSSEKRLSENAAEKNSRELFPQARRLQPWPHESAEPCIGGRKEFHLQQQRRTDNRNVPLNVKVQERAKQTQGRRMTVNRSRWESESSGLGSAAPEERPSLAQDE